MPALEFLNTCATPLQVESWTSDNLHFDLCIVATGAWSKGILKELGYNLPIEAERGYSLSLPALYLTKKGLSYSTARLYSVLFLMITHFAGQVTG